MKRKNIVIFVVIGFIIFFFVVFFFVTAEWEYIGTDAAGNDYLYNTRSVSRGQDTTTVWVKVMLSDKDKASVVKEFPKINGIENINNTVTKYEINCSKNVFRATFEAWHSSEGKVIYSQSAGANVPGQFFNIPPGTMGAFFTKTICKNAGGK